MYYYRIWIFMAITINLAMKTSAKSPEASPCPRLFTYEGTSAEPDRWYGIITLLSDFNLNGIWLRIIFDRPIIQLGNWFGEVQKKGVGDYAVKNPGFNLKAHTTKTIRFFVKYNINEPPPQLLEFRINAKTVCPEDLATTTPSTTTEHLFTNMDDEMNVNVETTSPKMSTLFTTTPKSVFHNELDDSVGNSTFDGAGSQLAAQFDSNQDQNSDCGTTVIHRQEKRIKQVAHKGEFPWHATIYYTGITISYLCGGSLISKHHVLTVAHCMVKGRSATIIDPERLVAYLGKHYIRHATHHEGMQMHFVSDIIAHPSYNAETFSNDIAILKLLESVDITDVVRPVCIWTQLADYSYVAKRPGTVVGWGYDRTGKIQNELMFTQMLTHGIDACSASPIGNYIKKHSSGNSYCANFLNDTEECVGDSGGGMVFPISVNKDKMVWQLRGLVSISIVSQRQLQCDRHHYALFTDVANYVSWIKEAMKL